MYNSDLCENLYKISIYLPTQLQKNIILILILFNPL